LIAHFYLVDHQEKHDDTRSLSGREIGYVRKCPGANKQEHDDSNQMVVLKKNARIMMSRVKQARETKSTV
jgi:hypothetical protein